FIADRHACHDNEAPESPDYFSPQDYASLLVKQCMRTYKLGGANHFFQKQLSRRVRMLVRNNKSHCTYIKRVMAVPLTLAVALFFVFLQSEARTTPTPKVTLLTPNSQKPTTNLGAIQTENANEPTSSGTKMKSVHLMSMNISKPVPPVLKNIEQELLNNLSSSKIEDAGIASNKVFKFVEEMPAFPGGEDALMRYLTGHIHYPSAARKNGIQGTVVVQFNVNPDGHLSDVFTVSRKLGGGLEQEAMRVVNEMPNWIAGKQNGKKVIVQYSLPVRFVLQDVNENTRQASSHKEPLPPPSPSLFSPSQAGKVNNASDNKVFKFVQQMPSFPGGNEALMNFL
ncbi:MAG: TonB family protein, partial [Chitinophagaceae bacterium]